MFGPFLDAGISFDEVRRMTLHDVALAHGYWRRNPPLRTVVMMVAKALGVEFKLPDKPNGKSKHMTAEEAMRFMAATGGKIPGLGQLGGG